MTLADFLKNIADGIREKEKSAKPIPAAQYASRLMALQTVNDEFDAVLMIHAKADDGNIYGIESYKSLTVVEGAVGSKAFTGYDALENVTIGNGVTAIEEQAFYNCRNLTKVTIGNGIERIGNSAFENCQSLVDITYIGTMAEWEAIEKGGYWNISTGEYTIHCIDGEIGKITVEDTEASRGLELTLNNDGVSYSVAGIGTCTDTDIIIPRFYDNKFVTRISTNAFYYNNLITSVNIPGTVKTIGEGAFQRCGALASIIINDGVTTIHQRAFYDCPLTSLHIPASVDTIYGLAFSNCSSLISITVDENNTMYYSSGNCIIKIPTKAVRVGCSTSIIPSDGSVTGIGNHAFYGCSSLASITIPDSITYIDEEAFYGCSLLTDLIIPDSVTTIGYSAFESCYNLKNLTIGNGVTTIESSAFRGVSNLENIVVDKNNAFYHSDGNCLINTKTKTLQQGCNTSVIPTDGSVTSIGYWAFSHCDQLTSVVIPDGVTDIGYGAFYSCDNLANISIPNSVTSIGNEAFYGCGSLVYNEYGNGKYLGNNNYPYLILCQDTNYDTDTFTIHEDTKFIGDSALYYHRMLTNITLPNSIIGINSNAFYGCELLTSITMSKNIKNIGSDAFYNCDNLLTINAPWSEGAVEGAPWGAYNATINYNYSEE